MKRLSKITSIILVTVLFIGILATGAQAVTFESEPLEIDSSGEKYDISNDYKVTQHTYTAQELDFNPNTGDWDSKDVSVTIDVFEVPLGTTITLLGKDNSDCFLWVTDIDNNAILEAKGSIFYEGTKTFIIENSEKFYHIMTGRDGLLNNDGGTHVLFLANDKGFWVKGVETVSSDNPDEKVTITATPTASKVLVNGQEISFDAYTINQNNYFKLRDIASVLSGTNKQFEVTWNSEKGAIEMLSNQAYTSVGGELAAGDGLSKTPVLNTAKVYLDGKEVNLTAYTINGNNYFKLRDLGQLFNFGVSWNGAVVVDTSTGYADDTQSQTMTPEQQAALDEHNAELAAGGGSYQSGVEWMEELAEMTDEELEAAGFTIHGD